MAMNDEIVVAIKADIDDLKRDLRKADDQLDRFGRKGEASGDKLGGGMSRAAGKIGLVVAAAGSAVIAINKLGDAISSNIDKAREFDRLSKRVGVSKESFSELSAVVARFGAESEDLFDVFKDLNVRITDAANGATSYEEALNKVGLKYRDLVNLSPEQQFLKFSDAIKSASEEMGRFAIDELVSDPGIRMIEVLRQGSSEINKMRAQVLASGEAMDALDFARLEKAGEAQRQLNRAMEAFGRELSVAILPALTEIVTLATKGTQALNKMFGEDLASKTQELAKAQQELVEAELRLENIRGGRGRSGSRKKELEGQVETKRQEVELLREEVALLSQKQERQEQLESGGTPALTPGGSSVSDARQAINDKVALKIEENQALLEAEQLGIEARNNLIAVLERQRIVDEHEASKERIKIAEMEAQAKKQAIGDSLTALSSLMNSESRKMFEVGKAAAIAQSVMSTYQGATRALAEVPYPFNFVAAASVTAAGIANVQRIASTQFGGGGGAVGGAGGGAGAGGQTIQQEQVTFFDVNLQGERFGGEQVRGLIDTINGEIDDGAKLGGIRVR